MAITELLYNRNYNISNEAIHKIVLTYCWNIEAQKVTTQNTVYRHIETS